MNYNEQKYVKLDSFMEMERTIVNGWQNLCDILGFISEPVKKCLVFGGASGYEIPHLQEKLPSIKLYSLIDIGHYETNITDEKNSIQVHNFNIFDEDLIKDEAFDLVVALRCFQISALYERENFPDALLGKVVDKGFLLFSVPTGSIIDGEVKQNVTLSGKPFKHLTKSIIDRVCSSNRFFVEVVAINRGLIEDFVLCKVSIRKL